MVSAQNVVALSLFVASSAAVKAAKEDWCYHGFGCSKPTMHMNCAPDCINWAQWCAWTYQNMGNCNACGLLVQNGHDKPCEGICAGCASGSNTFVSQQGSHGQHVQQPAPQPAPASGDQLSVKGDPFVVDSHGNKVQFFMPLAVEQELLHCGDWTLFGKAFGTGINGDHQQWFDNFRMSYEGNKNELEVAVAKNQTSVPDEADISAPQDASKELAVLDMKIAGVKVSKTGAVASENACLAAVWKTTEAETIQFSCGGMVLQIKSALAQKFDEEKKQILYTHLDLRFLELQSATCKGGILAEIWGFSPMSQKTAEMLQPPKN